jgi:hypothetical protein
VSSFVVGTDHIDYLVTAALRFAPDEARAVEPDPTELGRLLLAENVATVAGRYLGDDDPDLYDEIDEEELAELEEEREVYRAMVDGYVFRPVDEVDAVQAAAVAECWQYQRTRESADDLPPTWVLADSIRAAALATLPAAAFTDPSGARDRSNLKDPAPVAWNWSRPAV